MNAGRPNVEGRQCLWDAYQAKRPAEFISTQPTTEGDPISFVYRILGDGSVEIFIDQTYDLAGSNPLPHWVRLDCRTLNIIDGAQGQPAFGPGDCDETPVN